MAFVDGRWAAVGNIDHPGLIYEEDLESGARRLLTAFDGYGGLVTLSYSPDSAWLLVESSEVRLVRVRDGAHLSLGRAPAIAWAPSYGASALLRIDGAQERGYGLSVLDLETNTAVELGPIEVESDAYIGHIWDLDVRVGGHQALAVSPYGFSRPFDAGLGHRGKVQILDLESRTLEPVTSPTYPTHPDLERDQRVPRWIQSRQGSPVVLAADLASRLDPGIVGTVDPEFELNRSRELLQRCATDLEWDCPTRDPAKVRVELLRSMASIMDADPALGQQFVDGIREATFAQAMRDEDGRPGTHPMMALDLGLYALQHGDFDEYPWTDHAFRPKR